MKKIIEELSSLEKTFDYTQIENIVSLFESEKYNKFVGFAAGRMGYSLKSFVMRLDHMGFNSYMIGDTNFPRVDNNTVAFINSSSGETKTNILYAEQAVSMGAFTVLLTCSKGSTLNNLCDVSIFYQPLCSKQIMKSLYEQFSLVVFDYICSCIIERMNLSIDIIENNHSISE